MIKKILIVDDHEDVRLMYKLLLKKYPDLEIAGQASTAVEALQKILEIHPDLVISDVSLPGMDGFELTKEIKARHPGIKVAIASGYDPESYSTLAKNAGADEFIAKSYFNSMMDKIHDLVL